MSDSVIQLKKLLEHCSRKLEACETSFHTIVNRHPDGIVVADREGIIRFANPVVGALLSRSTMELTGSPLGYPLSAGAESELEITRPNGTSSIIQMRVAETEWNGEAAYLCTLHDFTDYRSATRGFQESNAQLKAIFSAFPDLLFQLDQYDIIRSFHAGRAEDLYVPPEQFLGKRMQDVLPAEVGGRLAGTIRKVHETGELNGIEYPLDLPGGRQLFEARISPLPNGSLIVMVRNITEPKRIEQALRESEEKFSKSFRSMPTLCAISSLDEGRYIEVNKAFMKAFGYQQEEVIGHTSLELGNWADIDLRRQIVRMVKEGQRVRDWEVTFRRSSGEQFVGLMSAELIDIQGAPCLLSIVNDITERKKTEEAIELLNTDLACRAAELEAANEELEAFSYTVSHDLRAPLTNISGFSQVILELYHDTLDRQGLEFIEGINREVERMDSLISTLLNFSRLKDCTLLREQVDLSAMAIEISLELQHQSPERQAVFDLAEGVTVTGDSRLLRIALNNLMENAWKYTSKREQTRIEFGVVDIDDRQTVFLRDNGAGFDMAEAEKLFSRFHRLHPAEQFKGHGIGLATVRRIIQRHDGRIWAEGEVDHGATFYFTLGSSPG